MTEMEVSLSYTPTITMKLPPLPGPEKGREITVPSSHKVARDNQGESPW